jgi:hypothetical protein
MVQLESVIVSHTPHSFYGAADANPGNSKRTAGMRKRSRTASYIAAGVLLLCAFAGVVFHQSSAQAESSELLALKPAPKTILATAAPSLASIKRMIDDHVTTLSTLTQQLSSSTDCKVMNDKVEAIEKELASKDIPLQQALDTAPAADMSLVHEYYHMHMKKATEDIFSSLMSQAKKCDLHTTLSEMEPHAAEPKLAAAPKPAATGKAISTASAASGAAVDPVKAMENEVKKLEDKEKALEDEMKGAVSKVEQAKQAEAKMEGDVAKLEVEKAKRDAALKALEEKKKSDEAMDKKLKEDETKVVSVEKLAQAEKASLEKKLKEETNLINELENKKKYFDSEDKKAVSDETKVNGELKSLKA